MKETIPMSGKTRGLIPLPPGDVPAETQCVSICIPAGDAYMRELFGCLYEMTHWNNYERDDTHKGTLVAQAWRGAIMQGMLNCYQFKNINGVLNFSNDGGATWTPVTSETPGPGEGSDPRDSEPLLPARTGSNIPCLSAANAVACYVELHRQLSSWYAALGFILDLYYSIGSSLMKFFPQSWSVFGLSVDQAAIAIDVLAHSASLNMTAFSSTIQDELTCILYCHAGAEGRWNATQYTAVLADIDAKTGDMWDLLYVYLNEVSGMAGLNNAGTTTSVASRDCAACDCGWCWEFAPDWDGVNLIYAIQSGAVIVNEQWFDGGTGYYNMVYFEVPITSEIHEIIATYDATPDIQNSGPENYIYIDTQAIGNRVVRVSPPPGGTGLVMHYTGSVTPSSLIGLVIYAGYAIGHQPGGTCQLTSLIIKGPGDNPFGDNNCEP
jgi:hypothetical protein